ncbi:DUF3604 domain-containing protein [Myxococcota bacterium]|nr:DUF3604 domain-containing protein [Myxococcota bacterium]
MTHRIRTRLLVACLALLALLVAATGCDRSSDSASPSTDAKGAAIEATAKGEEKTAAARALAPSGQPYSEEREACADRDPSRQVFWGELHVHSALSMDAWLWDLRSGPDETYRFGKGEEVLLPPLDESGRGTRPVKLERALDFVALTDHADFQGEVSLCTRPGSPMYDSATCKVYRGEGETAAPTAQTFGKRMAGLSTALDAEAAHSKRSDALCGPDGALCRTAMKTIWEEQQAAAERHYDRSAQCRFTTFNAYEYTATPGHGEDDTNKVFRGN